MGNILGLDLGTNSIGWALLETGAQSEPTQLIDCGSRIFLKAVEDKTPTPKNHARRRARLARRVLQRRARRHARLESYLVLLGWLPNTLNDTATREQQLNTLGDPIALRAKGLDAALTPHELGRALLHLGMRRGFLSTRVLMVQELWDDPDIAAVLNEISNAALDGDIEAQEDLSVADKVRVKEEGQFKKDISELQNSIDEMGCRTLGEYLHKQPNNIRKRGLRTGRSMYQKELELLFKAQKVHHPDFNEEVYDEIYSIMFHQRPITWDRNTIGKCSLKPKCKRTHTARLEYQRFRYLQDINHIRWDYAEQTIDAETGEVLGYNVALTAQDRSKLCAALESQKTMSWTAIKKLLGLDRKIIINLENSKPKGLQGNHTTCDLRKRYPRWDSLNSKEQTQLVDDLLSFEKLPALKKRLLGHWQCDIHTAVSLIEYSREIAGTHGNLSLAAIRKLLPFLEQGMRYDEARKAAGYAYEVVSGRALDKLPTPPDLRNPVVNKALFEVRRVVNAIIAHYGKPDAIHIELPRDLTMSAKQKEKVEKQNKANAKANDNAKEQYASIRQSNPHLNLPERYRQDDLLKYRLWQEQHRCCPYSGKPISETQLFSAAVEVEHILPYARTLNDSYMNKVVAFADENRAKGNRTPFEAYHGDRYEAILERTKHLPKPKRDAFLRKELDGIDDFINSQLTDTAYISREVVKYTQQLYTESTRVSNTKGAMTAYLRHQWGLNTVLGSDEKNRSDHRHHAIDAIVIAATTRSLYQKIVHSATRHYQQEQNQGSNIRKLDIPTPWQHFHADIKAKIKQVIVSHASNRKLADALHEATAYGLAPNGAGGQCVVYRLPLNDKFNDAQIGQVLDPALREQLRVHLSRFDNNPKIAFSPENAPRRHTSHSPIRHVRIIKHKNYNPNTHLEITDKRNGKTFKRYPLGNNHHVEIIRHNTTGKYKGVFVSTLQASLRARRDKQPVIQREHGEDWTCVMVLCINDMVEITQNGKTEIYRVQTFQPNDQMIWLRSHQIGGEANNKDLKFGKAISVLFKQFNMKPLSINALGHILNRSQKS